MVQTFHEMWAELLEELVYGILDHPIIESVHSLNHWNLVMCEGIPARCDPQRTLELVSYCETRLHVKSDDAGFNMHIKLKVIYTTAYSVLSLSPMHRHIQPDHLL